MVDTLDFLCSTSAIETAPLIPKPEYVSLRIEGMERITPLVSGGDGTQKLKQKEDFWIRRLEALNNPDLGEDVDLTGFLNGFPHTYSLLGVMLCIRVSTLYVVRMQCVFIHQFHCFINLHMLHLELCVIIWVMFVWSPDEDLMVKT